MNAREMREQVKLLFLEKESVRVFDEIRDAVGHVDTCYAGRRAKNE